MAVSRTDSSHLFTASATSEYSYFSIFRSTEHSDTFITMIKTDAGDDIVRSNGMQK